MTAQLKTKDFINQKKKYKAIQDRVIRDIRNLFKQEDDYCESIRVDNLWKDNYIRYESNGDRNKSISKITP